MASVYKPTYWYTDPETGKKEKRKLSKWYVKYKDADGARKRIPGFTDKSATHELAAKLEREAELGKRGVFDPYKQHRQTTLTSHVMDFENHLKDKGNTADHVQLTVDRVNAAIEFGSFHLMSDVSASVVERFLGSLIKKGRSVSTRNHYLGAFQHFYRWLVRDRRTNDNPVEHLKKLSDSVDRRHDRRALTDDEFRRLVVAAESGSAVEAVNGIDRAMIYVLAAWTGYRRGELASLTLRSFDLDSETPCVRLKAANSKNRQQGEVPLHPVVVERLRSWIATRPTTKASVPLLPLLTASGKRRKTAKMMKRDLASARSAWLNEAKDDDKELERRTASDFLTYCDDDGLFADFHANRHTFISNLGRAGVPLATAQKLARHADPKLTANVYTHIGASERAEAIRGLSAPPMFGGGNDDRQQADPPHAHQHVQTPRVTSHDLSSSDQATQTQSTAMAAKLGNSTACHVEPFPGMSSISHFPSESGELLTVDPEVAGSSPVRVAFVSHAESREFATPSAAPSATTVRRFCESPTS